MKPPKTKSAKLDVRFTLGTDGAAFYLSHQNDFVDDPERPGSCLLETDIWRKETKAGRVAAFNTGGDGGYAFRITDGPLTSSEAKQSVQSASFYLKVSHGSLALRSDYAQEWFDIPNGEYVATVSAIAIPEEGGDDLPNFVIAFAPLGKGKKPKALPEPPQLTGLAPEPEEDEPEDVSENVEDEEDEDEDEEDDEPDELPMIVAPGVTVFFRCGVSVTVPAKLWDSHRDLPGDGEFVVVPTAEADRGYRCRFRGGSMDQGGQAEFTMEGIELAEVLSRRPAKLLPMATVDVFDNSNRDYKQSEMDRMEKEFAAFLKVHAKRLGIKKPAEVTQAVAKMEYAIDRISYILGQLQLPFDVAHKLAFESYGKQIAGILQWMASPDRAAEIPKEHKPGKADAAYLAKIMESPRETAPRLAYADYLADKDPNRAEFIRMQCKMAELEEDDPERDRLHSAAWDIRFKHGDDWAGPVRKLVQDCGFRRGFVEQVGLTTGQFLKNAEKLFTSAPIDELRLKEFGRDPVATLKEILARPELIRVGRLWIGEPPVGTEGAEAIAACPHLANLRTLHMPWQTIGAKGLKALAGSPYLTNVTDLWFCTEKFGVAGAKALVASKTITRLKTLWLSACGLGDAGIQALADWPGLASVTTLDISENGITRSGAEALAASRYLSDLKSLKIGDNIMGDAGVLALANSKSFPNLVRFDVGGSRNTGGCGLTDAGVAKLVATPITERLVALDLNQNRIGSKGVTALLGAAKRFPKLRNLGLFMTSVSDTEKKKLVKKFPGVNNIM